ncbi:MAG: hypothetical protein J6Y07_02660 [Alphaproteobacteria bacterium]|nr:hypothetical protein [Alphaproteobacteria bacterium]
MNKERIRLEQNIKRAREELQTARQTLRQKGNVYDYYNKRVSTTCGSCGCFGLTEGLCYIAGLRYACETCGSGYIYKSYRKAKDDYFTAWADFEAHKAEYDGNIEKAEQELQDYESQRWSRLINKLFRCK